MPSTFPASRARPSALRLADGLKKAGAEAAVITLADSVCWLFNIRGHDVPHTPFTLAFAILHDDGGADLFLDPAKRTAELMAHLGNAVRIADPGAVHRCAGRDERQEACWWTRPPPHPPSSTGWPRLAPGSGRAQIPASCPRPAKISLEIEGMRKAHIRDGAALARFLSWFESDAASGELTEIAGGRDAGRFSPRHRMPERRVLRHHLGRGQQRRHRALPRDALHQPRHHQRRDVPFRFRRAISRRHHRRHPHRDGGRGHAPR